MVAQTAALSLAKVPASATTESGYSIADASAGFTHYNIACDTSTDATLIRERGVFASALNAAFETKPGVPLQIPSKIGRDTTRTIRELRPKLYDRIFLKLDLYSLDSRRRVH